MKRATENRVNTIIHRYILSNGHAISQDNIQDSIDFIKSTFANVDCCVVEKQAPASSNGTIVYIPLKYLQVSNVGREKVYGEYRIMA